MAGICILQEKAAQSARPERRQRVQTHVGTRTMTCTANSAALPPCLSSPRSRDGGYRETHPHRNEWGDGERMRCSEKKKKTRRRPPEPGNGLLKSAWKKIKNSKGAPKGDGEGGGEGGNGKRSALVILSLLIGLQLRGFWPS